MKMPPAPKPSCVRCGTGRDLLAVPPGVFSVQALLMCKDCLHIMQQSVAPQTQSICTSCGALIPTKIGQTATLCSSCIQKAVQSPLRPGRKYPGTVIDDLYDGIFDKDLWSPTQKQKEQDELQDFINRLDYIPTPFYFETPKGLILEVSSKTDNVGGDFLVITIITQDGKRLPVMEPIERSTLDNPGVPIEIKVPLEFVYDSTNTSALILRGRQLGATFGKDVNTRSLVIQFLDRKAYLQFVKEFPVVLKGFNDNPILS